MSYYLVANYKVTNPEMYKEYRAVVGPTLVKYGVKVLVSDHKPNDAQGTSDNTLIVLEFESEAAAMNWYNSPEYQAIIHLRIDATEGWLRWAPQFVMPASA